MLEVVLICLAVAIGIALAMRIDVEPRHPSAPPAGPLPGSTPSAAEPPKDLAV